MNKTKVSAISAVLLVAMSQMNINLIINGFKISLAVILLPILLFLLEEFRPVPVILLTAPGVLALRCGLEWLRGGAVLQAAGAYAPEMAFFLAYGGLFALYTHFVNFKTYRLLLFVPLVGVDFISNMAEMTIRLGAEAFRQEVVASLLAVAVGRTALAAVILAAFDSYGIFILKRDDHERYKKLLLLISQLKSEVVWMNKNTLRIENTMSTAYSLYNELGGSGASGSSQAGSAAQMALTVAKDVHEIKKEYFLIMRGISTAMQMDMEESGMWLRSILQILQESTLREAETSDKNVKLTVTCGKNLYTDKHYYLMSVLQNLLSNALEAASDGDEASAKHTATANQASAASHTTRQEISLTQREEGQFCHFLVKDNCGGIKQENIDNIFLPGFSTKISYETGEINRGLGLCLVRDIVCEQLGGRLEVSSVLGEGTEFTVIIPKGNLVS